jgi:hypothetical protein
MATLQRIRCVLGVYRLDTPAVLVRGQTMHDGLGADVATYAAPNPPLPAFQALIQSCAAAQQLAQLRGTGAAAERDVQRSLLLTGMETQRMYVQSLADAMPLRAVALIQNAGLIVAEPPVHHKAILTLRLGKQSGSVDCDANVRLLVGAGTPQPTQNKFFNWEYTVDGGKTFIALLPTTRAKVTIPNLTPLATVGVRVNLNNATGPGEWTHLVSILVR